MHRGKPLIPDTQLIKWHVLPRGQKKANDRTIKLGHRASRNEATGGQMEKGEVSLLVILPSVLSRGWS